MEVQRHKDFFKNRDATGRIYLSLEGINGQMSALKPDALAYIEWMRQDKRFNAIEFKVHLSKENVFPRMTVKVRRQLVALDCPVDLSKRGEYIAPSRFKEMLQGGDALVIDVRNNYESKVGHFKSAILPDYETFREFPKLADELKEKYGRDKPVIMYCTGGIRCELYSSLLKEKGFQNVFQLQGGVIKYGQEMGNEEWEGKLFVFDDRLVVSLTDEVIDPISECYFCKQPCDTYYNCANMDCNALFLCCPSCLEQHQGCCREECCQAPLVRAFCLSHKPFRRSHLLEASNRVEAQEDVFECPCEYV